MGFSAIADLGEFIEDHHLRDPQIGALYPPSMDTIHNHQLEPYCHEAYPLDFSFGISSYVADWGGCASGPGTAFGNNTLPQNKLEASTPCGQCA